MELVTYTIVETFTNDAGPGLRVRVTWNGYDKTHEIQLPDATSSDDYLVYIPEWASRLFREVYVAPPAVDPQAIDLAPAVGVTDIIDPDEVLAEEGVVP